MLVLRGSGLRDADILGASDPYAVCRVGPSHTAWDFKASSTERHSGVVQGSHDPEWQFACTMPLPPERDEWELHVRIFDRWPKETRTPRGAIGGVVACVICFVVWVWCESRCRIRCAVCCRIRCAVCCRLSVSAFSFGFQFRVGFVVVFVSWDPSTHPTGGTLLGSDYLSFDDFLGECRVPLTTLTAHEGELRDYNLVGPKAQGFVTLSGTSGFRTHAPKTTVSLSTRWPAWAPLPLANSSYCMGSLAAPAFSVGSNPTCAAVTGSKVEAALHGEARAALEAEGKHHSLLGPLLQLSSKLGQYYRDAVSDPAY